MDSDPSNPAGTECDSFRGSAGQDRWFAELLRTSGSYFVEIGAGDGLADSNSYWFERQGWRGLCIEERSEQFSRLSEHRACDLHAGSLGAGAGSDQGAHGTGTLKAVLDDVHAPSVIDYLTIRGTPSAPEVLRGLGWGARSVRAIGVEHRGSEERSEQIRSLLNPMGYAPGACSDQEDYYLLYPERERVPGQAQLDLFAEYFRFGNEIRDAEIAGALRENLELDFVRQLYLFDGEDAPRAIVDHEKCTVVPGGRRRTIQELFAEANEQSSARCRVLINSDIVLDANCFRLPFLMGAEEFYALRRLEDDGDLNPRGGLDAWCWTDRCRIVGAEFEMGRVNCDLRLNQLAHEAYGGGFSCPSLTFSIHHRHASQIRPGTSNMAKRERHVVPGACQPVVATAHPFQSALEAAVRPAVQGPP